jgi:pyruvate kinase
VDYVAQSFVRTHTDVAALKTKIEAADRRRVIAKIELKGGGDRVRPSSTSPMPS